MKYIFKKLHLKTAVIFLCFLFFSGCKSSSVYYEMETSSQEDTEVSESSVTIKENAAGSTDEIPETDSGSAERSAEASIVVYVCGAVNSPGVYELKDGSRVCDAINAAGGLLPEAEARSLNQAEYLTDAQQITVYTKDEISTQSADTAATVNSTGTSEQASSESGKVNINTADKTQLMTVPGIGEKKAEDIIQYRTENGSFSSIEDICNISGIGDKTFEKLKNYIEV